MYKAANATRRLAPPRFTLSCGFEEVLLPTFVRQHYTHLLPSASPPLVWRVWGLTEKALRENVSTAVIFGKRLLANLHQHANLFGLKIPKLRHY